VSQNYPEHTFSFVIGSDNLALFHKWDSFENLVEEFTFYVYPRKGYPLEPLQTNMKILDGVPEIDVSSTEVRGRIESGQSISDLVPTTIEQYIQRHNLYKV
jgi:nicotinate-nucleotide adenylyltransferase